MSRKAKRKFSASKRVENLDLHGLPVHEALKLFVQFYNDRIASGNKEAFDVIHGYGSTGKGGEIGKRLRKLLSSMPEVVSFQTGQNIGVTRVLPKNCMPTADDHLEAAILDYCQKSRTEEKIVGKFRKRGDQNVRKMLLKLKKQGVLASSWKGKYKYYQRVQKISKGK